MSGESKVGQRVRDRIAQLHDIAPDSIGDLLHYELLRCDEEGKEFLLRCRTKDWMRNGPGTLHGGMCATVVDQAMGFIAYCIKPGEGIAPTVQMQVTYHRPLIPGEEVLICVHVVSKTKSLMHLSAEAYPVQNTEKVSLTASATYFYKSAQS